MSSRFLVGVGAWLLGAATATTGSMIVVGQLANGLLGTQTHQFGGTASTADFDERGGSATPTPAPTASASSSASPAALATPAAGGGSTTYQAAPQSVASTLLTSADGSVLANCQPGGAYLVYWSPAQGFEADDVARGPAQVASVSFTNQGGGVLMRVSCSSGTPVAHVTQLPPEPSASPGPSSF